MTNTLNVSELPDTDFRKKLPRYQEAYQQNNENLSSEFAQLAAAIDCSPAQLAIAWVLAQGDNIIPIPGTKKQKNLRDNAGSVEVVLTPHIIAAIDELLVKYPNTGSRYDEGSWAMVDKS